MKIILDLPATTGTQIDSEMLLEELKQKGHPARPLNFPKKRPMT